MSEFIFQVKYEPELNLKDEYLVVRADYTNEAWKKVGTMVYETTKSVTLLQGRVRNAPLEEAQ